MLVLHQIDITEIDVLYSLECLFLLVLPHTFRKSLSQRLKDDPVIAW
jgi:hypothetical protein